MISDEDDTHTHTHTPLSLSTTYVYLVRPTWRHVTCAFDVVIALSAGEQRRSYVTARSLV